MRSIVTIAVLGLLALTASAAFSYNASDPTDIQLEKYYMSILRGIDSGYEKGMYKKTNFVINAGCFG